jgi:hypothetical protein
MNADKHKFLAAEEHSAASHNKRNLTADFTDFTDKNSGLCIPCHVSRGEHSALAPPPLLPTGRLRDKIWSWLVPWLSCQPVRKKREIRVYAGPPPAFSHRANDSSW